MMMNIYNKIRKSLIQNLVESILANDAPRTTNLGIKVDLQHMNFPVSTVGDARCGPHERFVSDLVHKKFR